jgi:hypothetical protein
MEKIRIRDGKNSVPGWKNSDPGSGMEKIRIRDPGWKNSDRGTGMKKNMIRDGKNSDPG